MTGHRIGRACDRHRRSLQKFGDNMKNYTRTRNLTLLKILTLAGALAGAAPVFAQSAGVWMAKAGFNNIAPHVSSGDMTAPSLPGTKTDVGSASALILTGAYMFTDHVSGELCLGLPYRHDLRGDGALNGVGKIGSVQQLPPTLFAQYRFMEPQSVFRPYAGLGLTYAYFRKETGSALLTALTNPGGAPTTLKVDNAWGITPQLGGTLAFDDKWFADF